MLEFNVSSLKLIYLLLSSLELVLDSCGFALLEFFRCSSLWLPTFEVVLVSILVKGSLDVTIASEEGLILLDISVFNLFAIIVKCIEYQAISPVGCILSLLFIEIVLDNINVPLFVCR